MEVKKYAIYMMWTDRVPFEVIKVISDKTLEVRELDADLIGLDKMDPQNTQEYKFSSNVNNQMYRIRKSKRGYWVHKHKKFLLSDVPYKFFDYQF